jgi:endoglucanase
MKRKMLATLLSALPLTSLVSLVSPAPAVAAGAGYWHTNGRQLLDAAPAVFTLNGQACTVA